MTPLYSNRRHLTFKISDAHHLYLVNLIKAFYLDYIIAFILGKIHSVLVYTDVELLLRSRVPH